MKVVRWITANGRALPTLGIHLRPHLDEGEDAGDFEVQGERAGTPFGHLWIEDDGVSWYCDETNRYAVRSWESFARMMAEKGLRSPGSASG